jgi:hypothetical protein
MDVIAGIVDLVASLELLYRPQDFGLTTSIIIDSVRIPIVVHT